MIVVNVAQPPHIIGPDQEGSYGSGCGLGRGQWTWSIKGVLVVDWSWP